MSNYSNNSPRKDSIIPPNIFPDKMKCIVLSVLACVAVLEAKPQPYLGFNRLGMNGLGNGYGYGNGIGGLGMGGLGFGGGLIDPIGRVGLGGISGSGYSQGNGYGGSEFNSGASGLGSQFMHSGGMGNFHDIGQHHNSLTSVTQAENTDNHDIGGGQAFDTGAQSGNGFNQFANGGSRYGNGYGSGQQNMMNSFL